MGRPEQDGKLLRGRAIEEHKSCIGWERFRLRAKRPGRDGKLLCVLSRTINCSDAS